MSDDGAKQSGDLAVSVTKEGARVSMSERILSRLFPDRWAKGRVKEAVAERIATTLSNGALLDPVESEFFEIFFAKELRRNRNLLEVVNRAAALAGTSQPRALPSPASDGPSADERLDERWVARFVRDAEDAADETMRDLLARILAGELDVPGSFSLRTLSVVRDLSQRTARLFQLIAPMAVDSSFLPPHSARDGFDFRAYYASRGIGYTDIIHLAEAGLLSPSHSVSMGVTNEDAPRFACKVRLVAGRVLVCKSPVAPREAVYIPGINIAVAGSELLRVLAPALDPAYPEAVAKWISWSAALIHGEVYSLLDEELGAEVPVLEIKGRPVEPPGDEP